MDIGYIGSTESYPTMDPWGSMVTVQWILITREFSLTTTSGCYSISGYILTNSLHPMNPFAPWDAMSLSNGAIGFNNPLKAWS